MEECTFFYTMADIYRYLAAVPSMVGNRCAEITQNVVLCAADWRWQ